MTYLDEDTVARPVIGGIGAQISIDKNLSLSKVLRRTNILRQSLYC